jgi:hypothetical protein
MASLMGTKWNLTANSVTYLIDFVGPGNQGTLKQQGQPIANITWAESPQGHFVIQWLGSGTPQTGNTIYFGQHDNGQLVGNGWWDAFAGISGGAGAYPITSFVKV